MDILTGLNPMQKQAVETTQGPVLVLAGAGSGKTKALVARTAYLMANGVRPGNILAFTFTNKAAGEMRERMEAMTGINTQNMWVGTFHGICLRILRRETEFLPFDNNFIIYDDNDQQVLLKKILKEMGLKDKEFDPRAISRQISKCKNDLQTAEEYLQDACTEWEQTAGTIYLSYQKSMLAANAVDFDDLIMHTVRLFDQQPEVLKKYQERFQYILVDEYQDTNYCQYYLIKQLAELNRNLCAVGDPDQSIYGWRGADISNILNFEKDYPECKIIKLEQNYRSTKNILEASNAVITNNTQRKPKDLWTDSNQGDLIYYQELPDDRSEGMFVVETIALLIKEGKYTYKDFAVVYRTHPQVRVVEDALVKFGYPYHVYGGMRFYERKEIKDTLAYLRLLINPHDDLSLARIINEPKRSIGAGTFKKLEDGARAKGISVYEALSDVEIAVTLPPAAQKSIGKFVTMIEFLKKRAKEVEIKDLLVDMWTMSGYYALIEEMDTVTSEARKENLKEFVAAAVDFQTTMQEAQAAAAADTTDEYGDLNDDNEITLENFLAKISLVTDMDNFDSEDGNITLLTMHAAKGLEFPVVFMVGMEEKIFPHSRAFLSETEMEEERRLCYVGMTRAKERLCMTRAARRNLYGQYVSLPPSRFISEIPTEYIDLHTLSYQKPAPIPKAERMTTGTIFTGRQAKPLPKQETLGTQLINIGDKVEHSKFGVGVVVKTEGSGDELKLSIAFPGQGVKVLMQKYAPIKMVQK